MQMAESGTMTHRGDERSKNGMATRSSGRGRVTPRFLRRRLWPQDGGPEQYYQQLSSAATCELPGSFRIGVGHNQGGVLEW